MREKVNRKEIDNYGNQFKDRKNNFDDDKEIDDFIEFVSNNKEIKKFIEQYLPKGNKKWKKKPNGDYGVDVGIIDDNKRLLLSLDLERWSKWTNDFPNYINHLSFLERKSKFIKRRTPFLMVWQNSDCSKYIIVDDDDILKVKPEVKYLKSGKTDVVRKLPLSYGNIFGENITTNERKKFFQTPKENNIKY